MELPLSGRYTSTRRRAVGAGSDGFARRLRRRAGCANLLAIDRMPRIVHDAIRELRAERFGEHAVRADRFGSLERPIQIARGNVLPEEYAFVGAAQSGTVVDPAHRPDRHAAEHALRILVPGREPFPHEASIRGGLDLCQAVLAAVRFFGPPRAGLQAQFLVSDQIRPGGVPGVDPDDLGGPRFGARNHALSRVAATIAEVDEKDRNPGENEGDGQDENDSTHVPPPPRTLGAGLRGCMVQMNQSRGAGESLAMGQSPLISTVPP